MCQVTFLRGDYLYEFVWFYLSILAAFMPCFHDLNLRNILNKSYGSLYSTSVKFLKLDPHVHSELSYPTTWWWVNKSHFKCTVPLRFLVTSKEIRPRRAPQTKLDAFCVNFKRSIRGQRLLASIVPLVGVGQPSSSLDCVCVFLCSCGVLRFP